MIKMENMETMATQSQLNLLQKLGASIKPNLSKREASDLIKLSLEKSKPVAEVVRYDKPDKFKEAREEKNKTMYVSYGKDLVIAGMKVDEAIDVVNKLINAF